MDFTYINNRIGSILLVLVLSSCITHRTEIEGNYHQPEAVISMTNQKIKPGDIINLRVQDMDIEGLRVVGIDSTMMTVEQWVNYAEYPKTHQVYLPFIQKIEKVDLEPRYPVGVPFTAALVIFYLLAR